MAGDIAQLPPVILTKGVKHPILNLPVNKFSLQIELLLMARLRNRGSPSWMQPKQLRMCPGMFRLPSFVFYGGTIKIGEHLKLEDFPLAKAFERWSTKLNASGRNNSGPRTTMKASPEGELLPSLVNVSNGFSFTELNGISKGNSYNANLTLPYIWSFRRSHPALKNEVIVIVAPYLHQRALYEEIVKRMNSRASRSTLPIPFKGLAVQSSSLISPL
jgi:hypothetical protein